ncbi:MAG: hypothetical protein LUQ32_07890 [Methanomicrobiales archaeon]|nr:hypothetical protein [Methanomicrobiales archaeon]
MISMRRAGIITIILILMILFAGCGQRVPTRNTTAKNPWGNTTTPPRGTGGSTIQTPVVPTTTSPIIQVTLIPTQTVTPTPVLTYRPPPPVSNLTANLTVIDEKILRFTFNSTAYMYTLENPPLLIRYTLTVPNITKTRVVVDPVSGSDKTVTLTYPDPIASFEVTVMDLETRSIIARNGYGGQYDIAYSKRVWVRYPGSYYIKFSGNRVTADVEFLIPNET